MDAEPSETGVVRFLGRRDKRKVIWSDKGTNFVVDEKNFLEHELLRTLNQHGFRIRQKELL